VCSKLLSAQFFLVKIAHFGIFICDGFAHACQLGLEGVVSKRKDSAYRSGRSPDWLKMKNAAAPAVKREEEEDWGKRGRR
jgi:hypothetical protein